MWDKRVWKAWLYENFDILRLRPLANWKTLSILTTSLLLAAKFSQRNLNFWIFSSRDDEPFFNANWQSFSWTSFSLVLGSNCSSKDFQSCDVVSIPTTNPRTSSDMTPSIQEVSHCCWSMLHIQDLLWYFHLFLQMFLLVSHNQPNGVLDQDFGSKAWLNTAKINN